jgi:hypothetical protein
MAIGFCISVPIDSFDFSGQCIPNTLKRNAADGKTNKGGRLVRIFAANFFLFFGNGNFLTQIQEGQMVATNLYVL